METPLLFNHSSMQKLRHCCQNLNLFPYLLYSIGNAKSDHLNVGQLLAIITERIFLLYVNVRQHVHDGLKLEKKNQKDKDIKKIIEPEFSKFQPKKRKENSIILTLAVYLAPFVLAFQLIGIFSLMIFGKYTPGFLFLLSALIFLGYISMKVLIQDGSCQGRKKSGKRKLE